MKTTNEPIEVKIINLSNQFKVTDAKAIAELLHVEVDFVQSVLDNNTVETPEESKECVQDVQNQDININNKESVMKTENTNTNQENINEEVVKPVDQKLSKTERRLVDLFNKNYTFKRAAKEMNLTNKGKTRAQAFWDTLVSAKKAEQAKASEATKTEESKNTEPKVEENKELEETKSFFEYIGGFFNLLWDGAVASYEFVKSVGATAIGAVGAILSAIGINFELLSFIDPTGSTVGYAYITDVTGALALATLFISIVLFVYGVSTPSAEETVVSNQ
jgi:hypothetical protein